MRTIPSGATEVGARLGEGIELAAYEVRPDRVRPGRALELIVYFRCHERVSQDWTVFAHGDHPSAGRRMRLVSDHPPADGFLPTSRWQAGQIIRQAAFRPGTPDVVHRALVGEA